MKALYWHGTRDVRVDTVADPTIQDPRDIVIKITSTAICGSDLHLFNGFQPTMKPDWSSLIAKYLSGPRPPPGGVLLQALSIDEVRTKTEAVMACPSRIRGHAATGSWTRPLQ
jgi:hypothetical protein